MYLFCAKIPNMKCTFKLTCLLLISFITTEIYAQKLNLLIGTYTKTGKSEGIYVYEFDTQTGKAVYKNKAAGLTNPSYLALSKDEKYVYAVSENGPGKGGVSSFTFDKSRGALTLLNVKPSIGDGPCYVAVDDKNNHVFLANYGGGSAIARALNPDGSISDTNQYLKYTGNSANKSRQNAPHAHSSVLSPDNKYLFISDLGTDRINIYRYNPKNETKPLTAGKPAFISVVPGSGPRHFDFHPNGKFAYSIQELTGNIGVYKYKKGKLQLIENISSLPQGFNGKVGAADVHVSPDGNFLYISNRDDLNEIAIYQIDQSSGKIRLAGRQSTIGRVPRNFVIDPTGNFLLVANQHTDSIIVFKRDKKTGLLSDTGERLNVGSPVCLKFAGN